jgi:hypothetical protein
MHPDVRSGRKSMISREQDHNISAWKNDPLSQELYNLAINPNRTLADDKRFYELRDQQRLRDFKVQSGPTEPELNQTEIQATKVLKFSYGVINPRKIK